MSSRSKSFLNNAAWPWEKLAKLNFWQRLLVKSGMFSLVVLFVHFPDPSLLAKQIGHLLHPERLIQTDFAGIAEINREIDASLPPNPTRADELRATERFVDLNVTYDFDWNVWGNADYWPTAAEVWAKRKEDCDGQAVLAASILRSRGFGTATLAGNITHVWVVVDKDELMSPGTETNFSGSGGVISVALPSWRLMLDGTAFYLCQFPGGRLLIMLLCAIVLCHHPSRNLTSLLAVSALCLCGYALIVRWSSNAPESLNRLDFAGGILLLGSAPILAASVPALVRKLRPREITSGPDNADSQIQ